MVGEVPIGGVGHHAHLPGRLTEHHGVRATAPGQLEACGDQAVADGASGASSPLCLVCLPSRPDNVEPEAQPVSQRGVTQVPEPLSPSCRTRVPKVSPTYRSHSGKHLPGPLGPPTNR
jgi:hypothetical protein